MKIKGKAIFDSKALYTSLLNACNANDNSAAADLLIKHAQLILEDSKLQSLGALAIKLSYGTDVVKELEVSLYSGGANNWEGDNLHRLVSQGLQAKANEQTLQQTGLAPLYPN